MSTHIEELIIDPEQVGMAFRECLYKPEELEDLETGKAPAGTVIVEGILGPFGFHPERLESQRSKVVEWLKALPHEFRKSGGGGWSFLNACNQANGVQWTGFHQRMNELFSLAIGLKLAEFQLPREMWSALPGGMPYIVIFVD